MALIEPHMPAKFRVGRPRQTKMRAVLDAIFYIIETGCQWRMLPKDFPPFTTVQGYFYQWRDDGRWELINHHLLMQAREVAGRAASPSAGVIDSQSVKTTGRCNLTSGNSVGEEVLRHTGCSDCGEGRPDVADPGYDRGRSHGTAHRRRLGWDGTGVHDAVQSRHAPGAGALPRGRAVRTQPRSARLRQRLQEQDARHHGRDGDRRRTQGRGN